MIPTYQITHVDGAPVTRPAETWDDLIGCHDIDFASWDEVERLKALPAGETITVGSLWTTTIRREVA